jgi:phage FluMu protein Com
MCNISKDYVLQNGSPCTAVYVNDGADWLTYINSLFDPSQNAVKLDNKCPRCEAYNFQRVPITELICFRCLSCGHLVYVVFS